MLVYRTWAAILDLGRWYTFGIDVESDEFNDVERADFNNVESDDFNDVENTNVFDVWSANVNDSRIQFVGPSFPECRNVWQFF